MAYIEFPISLNLCNYYIEGIFEFSCKLSFIHVLGKALEVVRTDVFAQSYCRKSAKIVLIITDGYSSDDVTLPAVELRDMGVVMLGIGFGQDTPLMRYTLESMSSDPKDQYAFIFAYDRLVEASKDISNRACLGNSTSSVEILNNYCITNHVMNFYGNLFINLKHQWYVKLKIWHTLETCYIFLKVAAIILFFCSNQIISETYGQFNSYDLKYSTNVFFSFCYYFFFIIIVIFGKGDYFVHMLVFRCSQTFCA